MARNWLRPARSSMRPAHGATHHGADPFTTLYDEVDRVLQGFLAPMGNGGGLPSGFLSPNLDVVERGGTIEISAELPGVDEKDVEVVVRDGVVSISGEKTEERSGEKDAVHTYERSYGSFHRTVPLGFDVDPDTVQARFKKGVLTLTVPKASDAAEAAKKIQIQSSD